MKNSKDQFFRINYPYGIIIDLQTKSYAPFNREYMSLGTELTEHNRYSKFSEQFSFTFNNNLTHEFIDYWESYIKCNSDMALQTITLSAEGKEYYQLWFYNDHTNPYTYRGRQIKCEWNVYLHRLQLLADKLQIDVSSITF
ncbi:MAG: hypothetical protein SNG27_10330 [Rikenellaceae bacterium]